MADDDDELDDEDPLERLFNVLESLGGSFRSRYYDRGGVPISLMRAAVLGEDDAYKRVAQDYLGDGEIWVSTVWLGLDHNFMGVGPPLIFETMMFFKESEEAIEKRRAWWKKMGLPEHNFPWEECACERYPTEELAREGHRKMVDSMRVLEEQFIRDTEST